MYTEVQRIRLFSQLEQTVTPDEGQVEEITDSYRHRTEETQNEQMGCFNMSDRYFCSFINAKLREYIARALTYRAR